MAEQRQEGKKENQPEQAELDRDRDARLRREAVLQQIAQNNKHRMTMEQALDKTLADSFPASDPLSSIPDPSEEEFAA